MSTSPNAPQSQLEAIPAPKRRKSNKPPQIREAVIAHALLGTSNTKIAKELDINRATVASILSSAEINQHIESGRSRAVSLIPRSLDVVEYRLEKNDGSVALGLLRGTQVLQNQAVQVNVQNNGAMTWLQVNQAKAENQPEQPVIEATTPASTTTSNSGSTPSTP